MKPMSRPQYSLAALFVVLTGFCLGFGLLIHRTLPWLLSLPFIDVVAVALASAGLVAVLVLFLAFLVNQR